MTTIAWDGDVLAADNCVWRGSIRVRTLKCRPILIDGMVHLIAGCGDATFCEDAMAYLAGTGPKPAAPDGEKGNVWGLLIDPDNQAWRLDMTMRRHKVYESFSSDGAGRDMALGALAVGATAKQAVEVCCEYSDYAAFGVTAYRLRNGKAELVC